VAMTAMQCSCALGFNLLYRAFDMLPCLDRYRVRSPCMHVRASSHVLSGRAHRSRPQPWSAHR
jgi:hypothetical protein